MSKERTEVLLLNKNKPKREIPLCLYLCSKSAIAVIDGIINFTWVVPQLNPMF